VHAVKKGDKVLVEIPKALTGVELLLPSLEIGKEIHKQLKTLANDVKRPAIGRETRLRQDPCRHGAWAAAKPFHARIFPQMGGRRHRHRHRCPAGAKRSRFPR